MRLRRLARTPVGRDGLDADGKQGKEEGSHPVRDGHVAEAGCPSGDQIHARKAAQCTEPLFPRA